MRRTLFASRWRRAESRAARSSAGAAAGAFRPPELQSPQPPTRGVMVPDPDAPDITLDLVWTLVLFIVAVVLLVASYAPH